MLSDAPWLTAHRARIYCLLLGIPMLAVALWIAVITLLHPAGKPLATDFDAFWAASRLAAAGHPASAYDHAVVEATERAATIMPPGTLPFYYPPSFLLLLLPLGTLGFSAALAAFLVAQTTLVLGLMRRLLPQGWAWLPLLAFPGFAMNAICGQNAALSTSCFAAAALWLERRPALAGAALGALSCKPQLAVCVPVALLAARRWRALAACGATAAGLAALSWLVLGAAPWHGFLAHLADPRRDIETIPIRWPMMQSLFGAIRLAGGGNRLAYGAQAALSVATLALLAWVAAGRPGARLEGACMAASTLLASPYLNDYDLAVLAVPLACVLSLAQPAGWLAWEKLLLAVLFVYPLLARPGGMALGVVLGPLLVGWLLLLLARRAALCPPLPPNGRAALCPPLPPNGRAALCPPLPPDGRAALCSRRHPTGRVALAA